MSVRGLFAAFVVVCGVEASLFLPVVSQAQLAETATAASIQGQVASMQKSNVLNSGRRARAMANRANQNRLWENQALSEMQSDPRSRGVDSANTVPFDEKSPVKGKSYSTEGIVVRDTVVKGQRVVFLVKIQAANRFQVLGFRLHDPSTPAFAENTPVRVTAVYAAKIQEPETGTLIHGFDDAVIESGQVASASNPGQPLADAEPEKKAFSDPLKGWEFRGTVESEGRSTGVFVNGDSVKYAQKGTRLEDGIHVASIHNGSARVVVEGRGMDVTPW